MALAPAPRTRSAHARRRGSTAGFTLSEVLTATVVLAVGLLGLQALGITTVRLTATGARSSEAVALAVRLMEDAWADIGADRLPTDLACTLPGGDQVSRSVIPVAAPTLVRVEVEVVPHPRPPAVPAPVSLHTYAYSAFGFQAPAPAAPCP